MEDFLVEVTPVINELILLPKLQLHVIFTLSTVSGSKAGLAAPQTPFSPQSPTQVLPGTKDSSVGVCRITKEEMKEATGQITPLSNKVDLGDHDSCLQPSGFLTLNPILRNPPVTEDAVWGASPTRQSVPFPLVCVAGEWVSCRQLAPKQNENGDGLGVSSTQ